MRRLEPTWNQLVHRQLNSREMEDGSVNQSCAKLTIAGSKVFRCRGAPTNITNIVIPNGIVEIGDKVFMHCSGLTSLTLPQSLESVGRFAFYGCRGLTSLTLSESLKSVGRNVFSGCSGLTSLTLPKSLESVDTCAFHGCRELTTLTLPHTLVHVGDQAFKDCYALTSLALPHALTSVGKRAFANCTALTSVVFRPPVSRGAFIAWAVSNSRHRDNWQLTTLKRSRNVLRLITALALWSRDVASVDPDGSREVFKGCPCCVIEYDD